MIVADVSRHAVDGWARNEAGLAESWQVLVPRRKDVHVGVELEYVMEARVRGDGSRSSADEGGRRTDRTRPVTIEFPKIPQPPVVPNCSGFLRAPTG